MNWDELENDDEYRYEAKCRYCGDTAKTQWEKSAYYELEAHVIEHHLNEVFSDLVKSLSDADKAYLISRHGWRLLDVSEIKE